MRAPVTETKTVMGRQVSAVMCATETTTKSSFLHPLEIKIYLFDDQVLMQVAAENFCLFIQSIICAFDCLKHKDFVKYSECYFARYNIDRAHVHSYHSQNGIQTFFAKVLFFYHFCCPQNHFILAFCALCLKKLKSRSIIQYLHLILMKPMGNSSSYQMLKQLCQGTYLFK